MTPEFSSLQKAVQHNCHITDAANAENYTLCIYLLKMREYFRWEQGYGLVDSLPSDALGNWVSERESLWDELDAQAFNPLQIDADEFDPFDNAAINQHLNEQGLVYSAGLGMQCKPNFFLGKLEQIEEQDGFRLLVSSTEYARGLVAPPAVSLGNTIVIRREALQHYLWGRVEEWRWKSYDNPVGKAIACYPFESDPKQALDMMTAAEMQTVRLHEIGEIKAGELLGDDWNKMLLLLPRSKAEFMVRTVRDNLADAISTLPDLLQSNDPARLHFYFGSLSAMRKEMSPALMQAYQHWSEKNSLKLLNKEVERSQTHWREVAQETLTLFRSTDEASLPSKIQQLLETCTL